MQSYSLTMMSLAELWCVPNSTNEGNKRGGNTYKLL